MSVCGFTGLKTEAGHRVKALVSGLQAAWESSTERAALWAAYQGCWLKQTTSWRCCYVPRLTGTLSKRTSGAPVWILWLKTLRGGDHTPWRKSGENKVYRAAEMNVRNLRTAWLFLMKQRCWNSWDWNLVLRKPVETLRRNRQMHKGNWIRNHWESHCNWGAGARQGN